MSKKSRKKFIIVLVIILMILSLFGIPYKIDSKAGNIEKQKADNSIFNDNITYKWEYHKKGDLMAYGLYTPSNAKDYEKIPMILYLHGSGETATSEAALRSTGLPGVWNYDKWKLKNFCAYVLCPHLGDADGAWNNSTSLNNVTKLLDKIIATYNVDRDNIIVVGESRGGTGALYMAKNKANYFAKCVAFSAFYSGPFNTTMDTLCFYSYTADDASGYASYWKSAFGEDRVFSLGCGHGSVGRLSLIVDNGSFTRSWYCTEMVNLIYLNGCLKIGIQNQ